MAVFSSGRSLKSASEVDSRPRLARLFGQRAQLTAPLTHPERSAVRQVTGWPMPGFERGHGTESAVRSGLNSDPHKVRGGSRCSAGVFFEERRREMKFFILSGPINLAALGKWKQFWDGKPEKVPKFSGLFSDTVFENT